MNCKLCTISFKHRNKGQTLCRACWLKTDKKGENNPNWKGGKLKCEDCSNILNTRNKHVKRCWDCYLVFCERNQIKPHNFKGTQMKNGYRVIYVSRERPHMLEHRYVMENHIGRILKPDEIVHHINGIRNDNRIDNLVITNRKDHEHGTFIKRLQEKIRDLELSITTSA